MQKKIQKKIEIFFFFKFLIFKKKKFLKFWRKFFLGFFFEIFFTFSAAPQKIRTTGKKIMKIHQLEQILANFSKCPYAGSMCPPPPPRGVFSTFPNIIYT